MACTLQLGLSLLLLDEGSELSLSRGEGEEASVSKSLL